MAVLLIVTGAAIVAVIPPDYDDYLAIIDRKADRLATTESPKIVFVGGSNLVFGLDSAAVERELGYQVVNMGLGFNVGLRFMLEMVRPQVRAGDVIVLVPEYPLFFGLFDGDERLLDVLAVYPEGLKYAKSPRQLYILARNLPNHLRFRVNRYLQTLGRKPDENCIYCPSAFNEYGDVTAHLDRPGKDVSTMELLRARHKTVNAEAIATMNEFARHARSVGATVLLSFPCVPAPQFEETRDRIDPLYARLKRELQLPITATPQRYAFPLRYFFDWVYHLNRSGRDLRTKQLIDDIRDALTEP